MTLGEKLSIIKQTMKAPKNLYNSFGKYHYRHAESILEAFKPFEKECSVFLTITDSVEHIGERIYIKAVAKLHDCESDMTIETTAYARESYEKKGMDDRQITGTASSYARKYALNGLFLLDDTKDADTDEYKDQEKSDEKKNNARAKRTGTGGTKKAGEQKKKELKQLIDQKGMDIRRVLYTYGVKSVDDLSETDCDDAIKKLKALQDKPEPCQETPEVQNDYEGLPFK